jgi:hypothetical protein
MHIKKQTQTKILIIFLTLKTKYMKYKIILDTPNGESLVIARFKSLGDALMCCKMLNDKVADKKGFKYSIKDNQ